MLIERINRFLIQNGWKKSPLTHPQGIVMRVTERCFLRCKMCAQNREGGRLRNIRSRERQRIDPVVLESMVEEISRWRSKPFIKLTGGEPLIEWKILQPFIARLRSIGCVIKLNTNAVLLRNHDLAEDIVRTGVDYLSVSIDGTRNIHNQVRGFATAFDNSRRGVLNVIKQRENLGATYPMVLISTVVSTINEQDIVNMSQVARDWGADWLNIQFLNFLTPARSEQAAKVVGKNYGIQDSPWAGFEIPELTKVDVEQLSRSVKTIQQTASCPVSVMKAGQTPKALKKFHYTDEPVKNRICHMPFVTMFIIPQATPVFCIDYPYYPYGDLHNQRIEEAWFGEKAQIFRNKFIKYYQENGFNFPQCLRCNWPFNT